jgi:hypothetical protein
MKVGDLVFTNSKTDYSVLGIVTEIINPINHQLWYDQRIVKVLYPDTGESHNWAKESLEVI